LTLSLTFSKAASSSGLSSLGFSSLGSSSVDSYSLGTSSNSGSSLESCPGYLHFFISASMASSPFGTTYSQAKGS